MSGRNHTTGGAALVGAVAASIVAHVVVLVVVGPYLRTVADTQPPEDQSDDLEPSEKMEVTVVPAKEPPEPKPQPREPEEPEPRERERSKEQREQEEQREKPRKKKRTKQYNRKAVVQKTNEEAPEEAQFVSEQANKVEEQTRARKTVQEFTKPSESTARSKKREGEESEKSPEEKLGSKAAVADRARKPSRRPPRPRKERQPQREKQKTEERERPEGEGPEPAPEESQKSQERQERRPEQLPMPKVSDYAKVFDEKADRQRRKRRREKGVGHDMFREIEQSKGSVKATLENYIPEVQPGNHTSVNAHADAAAAYVNRIHSKIHPRWGGTYLPHLDTSYGPGHPLSNSKLNTVLEFVIDGSSGELEEVTIVSSSGITSYDMEAVTIAKAVAPHTRPPESIVSPDGNVYMHWNFWRDQRQCGTFGVSVYKVNGEEGKEGSR